MSRRKGQKTLDSFFFRSRGSTGGDDEAARSPPGQTESIASEPRLDDEAEPQLVSTDVSASDVSISDISTRNVGTIAASLHCYAVVNYDRRLEHLPMSPDT
ncbi:unnamed protein product [Pleuronectes platessa]|uniref:Uncharacterized protein n=1 Tax=Pleuronectes platessa TaxID=8262 RepID=A0A9N7VF94_PLEPL|nr:unnamed protein product [Pleuronectes platessa]